jgi:hypothetical protein
MAKDDGRLLPNLYIFASHIICPYHTVSSVETSLFNKSRTLCPQDSYNSLTLKYTPSDFGILCRIIYETVAQN